MIPRALIEQITPKRTTVPCHIPAGAVLVYVLKENTVRLSKALIGLLPFWPIMAA